MSIFKSCDYEMIAVAHRVAQKKAYEMHLSKFVDKAVLYYSSLIEDRKEMLMGALMEKAREYYTEFCGKAYPVSSRDSVRVQFWTTKTFSAISKGVLTRKLLVREEESNEDPDGCLGGYFEVGLHRANIYEIYKHTDFRKKMTEALGKNFEIYLSAKPLEMRGDVEVHETTLWLVVNVPKKDEDEEQGTQVTF